MEILFPHEAILLREYQWLIPVLVDIDTVGTASIFLKYWLYICLYITENILNFVYLLAFWFSLEMSIDRYRTLT